MRRSHQTRKRNKAGNLRKTQSAAPHGEMISRGDGGIYRINTTRVVSASMVLYSTNFFIETLLSHDNDNQEKRAFYKTQGQAMKS